MAAGAISPFSGGREERPYVCNKTPPNHHILRAGLRDLVGGLALIRRGHLAYSLLGHRAADRRPHHDRPHPGPGGAARAWLPDDPLAHRVDLVRGGHRTSAGGPPAHRGAERRARGGCPLAGWGRLLVHSPPGVRGTPDQPPGWADGRGAGMARLRPAWPADQPLAAGYHPDPRSVHNRLASAHLLLRGRLPALHLRGRRPGDGRGDVLVHVVVQPHRRQRAHNARVARRPRHHPDWGALVRKRGRGTGLLGLWHRGDRRGDRIGRLRLAVMAWSCACVGDGAASVSGRATSAMTSASSLTNFAEFPFRNCLENS